MSIRSRLLIISNDLLDDRMAGPGLRYLEMARAMGETCDVVLAVPGPSTIRFSDVRLEDYSAKSLQACRELAEAQDFVLLPPFILRKFPFLESLGSRLIIDLYDPILFENLYYYLDQSQKDQQALNLRAVASLNKAAQVGDFFLCGHERQRDFWLGLLAANGRIDPQVFAQDPDLRNLIDVVGLGFPGRPPQVGQLLRGIHPLIPQEARLILWGGGMWDWLDPLSLVKAWPAVLEALPQARLVFLGTRHPNPEVPRHRVVDQTIALAEQIGEKDRTILFIEWLSYHDREALLCEADVGVSLHRQNVETHFSIRTRIFDYFWAKLPVLASGGDLTSELVSQYKVGIVVPPVDIESISRGIIQLLSDPRDTWAAGFDRLRERYEWPVVIEPLTRYCLSALPGVRRSAKRTSLSMVANANWQADLARARFILRSEGFGAFLRRSRQLLRRRLTRG